MSPSSGLLRFWRLRKQARGDRRQRVSSRGRPAAASIQPIPCETSSTRDVAGNPVRRKLKTGPSSSRRKANRRQTPGTHGCPSPNVPALLSLLRDVMVAFRPCVPSLGPESIDEAIGRRIGFGCSSRPESLALWPLMVWRWWASQGVRPFPGGPGFLFPPRRLEPRNAALAWKVLARSCTFGRRGRPGMASQEAPSSGFHPSAAPSIDSGVRDAEPRDARPDGGPDTRGTEVPCPPPTAPSTGTVSVLYDLSLCGVLALGWARSSPPRCSVPNTTVETLHPGSSVSALLLLYVIALHRSLPDLMRASCRCSTTDDISV